MEVGGQRHAPAALPTGKRPGTHCTGGWVGPRAGLDGCWKSRPHRDSIPGRFSYTSRYTDWAITAHQIRQDAPKTGSPGPINLHSQVQTILNKKAGDICLSICMYNLPDRSECDWNQMERMFKSIRVTRRPIPSSKPRVERSPSGRDGTDRWISVYLTRIRRTRHAFKIMVGKLVDKCELGTMNKWWGGTGFVTLKWVSRLWKKVGVADRGTNSVHTLGFNRTTGIQNNLQNY
jgi:hypothetical protein